MVNFRFALCILCPIITIGCNSNTNSITSPKTSTTNLDAQSDYLHANSPFQLPVKINHIQRVSLNTHNASGTDVSGSYHWKNNNCKFIATYYFYPIPQNLMAAYPDSKTNKILKLMYETTRDFIMNTPPKKALISEKLVSQNGSQGHETLYEMNQTTSVLRLYAVDNLWFLKHRYTYNKDCVTTVTPLIKTINQVVYLN